MAGEDPNSGDKTASRDKKRPASGADVTNSNSGKVGQSGDGAKNESKTGKRKKSSDAKQSAGRRTKLIPKDCKLKVRPARVHEVYAELRKVPVANYRNATAVLFRVFVELSVDVLNEEEDDLYKAPGPQDTWRKKKLRVKVKHAIDWLVEQGHLQEDGAKAAEKAFSDQPLSESSISILNGFVHNKRMYPDKEGLKTAWDNVQPFMEALWNTRPAPKS